MKKKLKTIEDPNGKECKCLFMRIYGVPVWIPVDGKDDFIRKCKLSRRLIRYANKANDQLRKAAQLVKEIQMSI